MEWNRAGAALLLAGSLWTDVRNGCIPRWWLLGHLLLAAVLVPVGITKWQELLPGVIPGLALLAAAYVTSGSVGTGDALLVMALGMYLGLWNSSFILMAGFVQVAVYGIFRKVCRHISMKRAVCFTPFLCIGFGLWWLLSQMGDGVL